MFSNEFKLIYSFKGANILSSKSAQPNWEMEMASPTPQDTAIVMYTSGSTGTPKVVIQSMGSDIVYNKHFFPATRHVI